MRHLRWKVPPDCIKITENQKNLPVLQLKTHTAKLSTELTDGSLLPKTTFLPFMLFLRTRLNLSFWGTQATCAAMCSENSWYSGITNDAKMFCLRFSVLFFPCCWKGCTQQHYRFISRLQIYRFSSSFTWYVKFSTPSVRTWIAVADTSGS